MTTIQKISRHGSRKIRIWVGLLILMLSCSGAYASSSRIVTLNYFSGGLLQFDAHSGASLGYTPALPLRRSELLGGPDGNVYVTIFSYSDAFEILKVDPNSGVATQFVDGRGYGDLRGMDFGPNGNLFVAAPSEGKILEFNGITGQYEGDFVSGIAAPIDLSFSQDGSSMFVARGHHQISSPSSILRYDGTTGTFIDTFATDQIDTPQNVLVGPEGDVYVTNQWTDGQPLVAFDGVTGDIKFAVSAGLENPQGMDIGIDGELLVASWDDSIKRFDAESGIYLGDLVNGSGLRDPIGVVFFPEPTISALIDIKPGPDINSINLNSKRKLPVALLGTDGFDVSEVDIKSVLFGDPLLVDKGGAAVSPADYSYKDVSHDGLLDLLLEFPVTDLVGHEALGPDTVEGLLSGKLMDSTPFEGFDSIRVVSPKRSTGEAIIFASTVPEPSTSVLALAALCFTMRRHR